MITTLEQLLAIATRKAERCEQTATYYAGIAKKRHLVPRWEKKAENWRKIAEMVQVTQKMEVKNSEQ